jgi:hypothetical protein
VAEHFFHRTFGVRPASPQKIKLHAQCSIYIAPQVYQPPIKESAVFDVVLVVMLIASLYSLLIPPCLYAIGFVY